MTQTRMSKCERRDQLLQLAAEIVVTDGAERLTLQTLADRAGVSKPITYNHFCDRKGLLVQLYRCYDEELVAEIQAIPDSKCSTLKSTAAILAAVYIDCVIRNGHVYEAVVAALSSYPEFADLRCRICDYFIKVYRELFRPLITSENTICTSRLIAIYGASEELARAVVAGRVSRSAAVGTLSGLIEGLFSPMSTPGKSE